MNTVGKTAALVVLDGLSCPRPYCRNGYSLSCHPGITVEDQKRWEGILVWVVVLKSLQHTHKLTALTYDVSVHIAALLGTFWGSLTLSVGSTNLLGVNIVVDQACREAAFVLLVMQAFI